LDRKLDTLVVEILIELPMILDSRIVDVNKVERMVVDPTAVEVVIVFMPI
jgi:hypothetical protein